MFQTVDYSSMVKQRSLGPDNLDDGTDPSSAFLDALRTRAMDEMHEAALEYGIVLKDLGGFSVSSQAGRSWDYQQPSLTGNLRERSRLPWISSLPGHFRHKWKLL